MCRSSAASPNGTSPSGMTVSMTSSLEPECIAAWLGWQNHPGRCSCRGCGENGRHPNLKDVRKDVDVATLRNALHEVATLDGATICCARRGDARCGPGSYLR